MDNGSISPRSISNRVDRSLSFSGIEAGLDDLEEQARANHAAAAQIQSVEYQVIHEKFLGLILQFKGLLDSANEAQNYRTRSVFNDDDRQSVFSDGSSVIMTSPKSRRGTDADTMMRSPSSNSRSWNISTLRSSVVKEIFGGRKRLTDVTMENEESLSSSFSDASAGYRESDGPFVLIRRGSPRHKGPISCMSVIGDTIWVGCGDGNVRIWSFITSQAQSDLKAHDQGVTSIQLVGEKIWTASMDGTVKVWSQRGSKVSLVKRINVSSECHCISLCEVSPDRMWGPLVSGDIKVWSSRSGSLKTQLNVGRTAGCALIYGDELWVGTERAVVVVDTKSCKEKDRLDGHTDTIMSLATVTAFEIWSGSLDQTIRCWSVHTHECSRVIACNFSVFCLQPVRQAECVWAGGKDGKIIVWSSKNGDIEQEFAQPHADAVSSFLVDPKGQISRTGGRFTRFKFGLRIGVLTISDRVSRGQAEDKSGPLIQQLLTEYFESKNTPLSFVTALVPDELPQIKEQLLRWCNEDSLSVVLTTGGTGFAPRDVTPEATKQVIQRETMGLTIAMMNESLRCTPHAALSRLVTGICNSTLIVNLPGSTKAVRENLQIVMPLLPHSVALIRDNNTSHSFEKNQQPNTSSASTHSHSHDHSHSHTHSHSHGCGGHHNDIPNPSRVSHWPMLPVPKALDIILSSISPPQHSNHTVPIDRVVGHVLREDITSTISLPPYPASVKDGFAVISSDGPGEYLVVDSVMAGCSAENPLQSGQIARITTGAAVPAGADAVVMVERTSIVQLQPETVKTYDIVTPGQDIRPIGSDVARGQVVLREGSVVGVSDVGLLSTVGVMEVPVHRWPTVAVLSTGDELSDQSTTELPQNRIWDSNRPMLRSAIRSIHPSIEIVDQGIAKDTKEDIMTKMSQGLSRADVLITSGGVSMGELDLIEPVMKELGADIHFGRILMKPGKPFTFATLQVEGKKKWIFALPGNPVSVMVTFYLLVLPSLRKMAGISSPNLQRIRTKLGQDFKMDPDRPEYHRCRLEYGEDVECFSTGNQSSCRLLSMYNADALVLIPQGEGVQKKGSKLDAFIIPK
ncbi:hypothetical protein PROFUN_06683 [Planoprotostelium fungivorum]|uniref:MoaB/Mog domain-containing protein n=1 Tax=Planoprotostelium fungivorum TaxID=1890364 RepID=A0A2P6NG22_9EUKA|nr:hypothetical protein PROFUN_06683 [Planoprotostelium fungivorum]